MSAQELRRLWADEYVSGAAVISVKGLAKRAGVHPKTAALWLARMGLPTAREQLAGLRQAPPRRELVDALERWGVLDTAQEYRVSLPRLELWMRYYNVSR